MDDLFDKIYESVRKLGFYNVMGKLELYIIARAANESVSLAAASRKISMQRTTFVERARRYGIKKHKH